jgi:hypothetical protein
MSVSGRVTNRLLFLLSEAAGVLCWLQLLSIPHVADGSPFPSLSTRHVIREIPWDRKEKESRSSETSSSVSSLVNQDPKNRHLLRTSKKHRDFAGLFQQCSVEDGQKGIFGKELI